MDDCNNSAGQHALFPSFSARRGTLAISASGIDGIKIFNHPLAQWLPAKICDNGKAECVKFIGASSFSPSGILEGAWSLIFSVLV